MATEVNPGGGDTYLAVGLKTLAPGERAGAQTGGLSTGYTVVRNESNLTICDGTGAVDIGGGIQNDTHLIGITILKNAGPATATIAGFTKDTGSATASGSIVLTGSTTADLHFPFYGAINSAAALTVTGSVDETVLVFWRPS